MNISSVGGASGTGAVGGANQNDFRSRMEQSMTPVAQLFGMTSDQFMSEVKASGKSLADYASLEGHLEYGPDCRDSSSGLEDRPQRMRFLTQLPCAGSAPAKTVAIRSR